MLVRGTAVLRRAELAMDKASARSYTPDGHLLVRRCPIAKAAVNPYYGREIPEYQALGLEPDRVYQLLRPPEELEKAAERFNGRPLLIEHRPVSAHDHPQHLTVGSVGTSPEWDAEAGILYNDLAVWEAEGIRGIEDEDRVELSPAYRYKAVMEPGEFGGVAYHGRMTDITGNHVALVPEGRQGSDIIVADGARENQSMAVPAKKRKHPRALLVQGALAAYLAPRLAQDQAVDLNPILADYTPATKTAAVVKAVTAAAKGKLAQDANLNDLAGAIDAFKDDEETAEGPRVTADESGVEDIMAMCSELPEEHQGRIREALKKAFGGTGAQDEPSGEVTQAAMDAAIKAASTSTEKRVEAKFLAMDAARREVRPIVGDIAVAMDSAEAIYKFALDHLKVDLKDVPASAYRSLVRRETERSPTPAPTVQLAQDRQTAADDLRTRFPGMANIEGI